MKQFFNLRLMTAVAVFFSVLFFTCKKSDNSSNNNSTYSSTSGSGTTTGGTTGGSTTGGTSGYSTTTGGATTGGTTTGGTTGGTTPAQVSLQGSKFDPSSITVAQGTTVTWINKDSYTHTVTSTEGVFNSGDLMAGGNYSYTFNTIGTFNYYCKYHKSMGMTGTVIVK